MVKIHISGDYLAVVLYQEFFAFYFDESKRSWNFQKNVRCVESVPKLDGAIECSCFSPCGNFFVVYIQKNIIMYSTFDWTALSVCPGKRKASSLQFFPTSKTVLLADKSGCASFYVVKNKKLQKSELSFGHNSMLTGAVVTEDEQFVITSDRDEKIRITKYPNVYNIEKYCLGHKMFVSCLGFLPIDERILISSSGDGTIRFWDFKRGQQLALYDCNTANSGEENSKTIIMKFVTCQLHQISVLAILKYKSNQVKIINVRGDLNKGLKIEEKEDLMLKCIPWDIGFHNTNLMCLLPDQSKPIACWSPGLAESRTNYNNIELYLTKNWDFILNTSNKISDEISILFKREVDNLQEYEQRKKARLLKTAKTS